MSHFIKKCVCGVVLAQCRCIGEKAEITVGPCTHVVTLYSTSSFDTPSFDTILLAAHDFNSKSRRRANFFRCHPTAYHALRNIMLEREKEEMLNDIVRPKLPDEPLAGKIFGLNIFVDHKLKPNEWRIESVFKK